MRKINIIIIIINNNKNAKDEGYGRHSETIIAIEKLGTVAIKCFKLIYKKSGREWGLQVLKVSPKKCPWVLGAEESPGIC